MVYVNALNLYANGWAVIEILAVRLSKIWAKASQGEPSLAACVANS